MNSDIGLAADFTQSSQLSQKFGTNPVADARPNAEIRRIRHEAKLITPFRCPLHLGTRWFEAVRQFLPSLTPTPRECVDEAGLNFCDDFADKIDGNELT